MKMILCFIILYGLILVESIKYETKSIDFNSLYLEKLEGSEMKFYSISLDSNLKDNDLLIDTRISNGRNSLFESPLILVSLKPLPNTDKKSQWVCGQLGLETCFIPNKYLSPSNKVYIGVLCEQCDFSLKTMYMKEEVLKDGENKLFHLKAGDKKVFKLDEFFQTEKDYIQISSFNLRMTQYKMNVEIVDKKNPQTAIEVPTDKNWIGGLQAIIKPNIGSQYTSKYDYRVIITAQENGIFNIEARSSNSIIQVDDKSIKFDAVKQGQKLCFEYKNKNFKTSNNIVIEAKSIKGDITFEISPTIGNELPAKLKLVNEKELKQEIKSDGSGTLVCAISDSGSAFFTLQIYLEQNKDKVKEYNKLLYNLLNKSEMYDLENIQANQPELRKIHNVPAFRTLLQNEENAPPINPATNTKATETTLTVANNTTSTSQETSHSNAHLIASKNTTSEGIHINGAGVAGIAVVIIFLIPVTIGSIALMSIFVNTKYIDQPLKIKIMD